MEIPIFENEVPVGTLRVSSQGLYTVFQARLPGGKQERASCADHSEFRTPNSEFSLTRLWLIGKCGAAAPLGLLRQEKEGRSLCRKLSRMECGRLPKNPVRALLLPNGEKPEKPAGSGENGSSGTPTPTEKANNSQARIPSSESSWSALSDGSLIDRERRLLALPWGGGAVEAPGRKLSLGEREYLLFRY